MALYEVILNTAYAGQGCVNRWNYIGTGTPSAVSLSFGLVAAFGAIYDDTAIPPAYPEDTILSAIREMTDDGVSFVQITALNVYDPVDFYQTPFNPAYPGGQGGDGLSPTAAYAFRTNVVNRDIRRGTKRFVGVNEGASNQGGEVSGSFLTLMTTLAERMTATLEYDDEGNTLTYVPAICSKEEYIPDPLFPAKTAYKYYGTLAEQLTHSATGFAWNPVTTIRSQNSRQYGRGS